MAKWAALLVTAVMILIGAVVAYSDTKANASQNTMRIQRLEAGYTEIDRTLRRIDKRQALIAQKMNVELPE